jgi:hypothetical protein
VFVLCTALPNKYPAQPVVACPAYVVLPPGQHEPREDEGGAGK